MQEKLFQEAGINFNDYPEFFKQGTWVKRFVYEKELDPEILAKLPPDAPKVVNRAEVREFSMPVFARVINRAGVILNGEEPMVKEGDS